MGRWPIYISVYRYPMRVCWCVSHGWLALPFEGSCVGRHVIALYLEPLVGWVLFLNCPVFLFDFLNIYSNLANNLLLAALLDSSAGQSEWRVPADLKVPILTPIVPLSRCKKNYISWTAHEGERGMWKAFEHLLLLQFVLPPSKNLKFQSPLQPQPEAESKICFGEAIGSQAEEKKIQSYCARSGATSTPRIL